MIQFKGAPGKVKGQLGVTKPDDHLGTQGHPLPQPAQPVQAQKQPQLFVNELDEFLAWCKGRTPKIGLINRLALTFRKGK